MYAAAFETLNLEADRVMSAPVESEAPVLAVAGLSLDLSRQWLDDGANTALEAHAVTAGFDMWRGWESEREDGRIAELGHQVGPPGTL